VPGIEVGIALLLLQGAAIAPFVYIATVLGLLLAFTVGQHVPLTALRGLFRDLRMARVCKLLDEVAAATPAERLSALENRLPEWLARITTRYRYVMIGMLINMPGTFVLGGGGGILMLSGMTGLFRRAPMLATMMIATAPVPFAVWTFGTVWLR
jgi:hypothetical protein